MTDKHIKDKFRYADGTNEQDNYENFINSFDVDDEVYYRGKHYIKFINEQLKAKEQECEGLKKDLHQNFKEKDKLHLIIDRLLEASGYSTNTASAEDFEDVYENMRYEKQQLEQLGQTLAEIKEIAETISLPMGTGKSCNRVILAKQILQKISEVENEHNG